MQNPTTPTPFDVTASCAARYATAPDMSFAACSMFSCIINLPASSGSCVTTPR